MLYEADLNQGEIESVDFYGLARTYRELAQLHAAIHVAKSKTDLFRIACETACRLSGADLVWIAIANSARTNLTTEGFAGSASERLRSLQIPLHEVQQSPSNLITTSFYEARAVVSNNLTEFPISEQIPESDWSSACSVPIMSNSRVVGMLVACSRFGQFFEPSNVELLKLIAQYISIKDSTLSGTNHRQGTKNRSEVIESELLLNQMEYSPYAVLVTTENNSNPLHNKKLLSLWGLKVSDLRFETTKDSLPKAILAKLSNPQPLLDHLQHIKTQPMSQLSGEIQLKDRRVLEYWTNSLTPSKTARTPLSRAWYFRDISARKGAEDNLKTSEQRLKTMFARAPIGIALIDSVSDQIFEVNQQFAQIVGDQPDQLPMTDWSVLIHPEDIHRYAEASSQIKDSTDQSFQIEMRLVRKDASIVWVHVTATRFHRREAEHPLYLYMVQDITETKDAQARILYLNRVHTVLSSINALIVRVRDQEELFKETCRIVTQEGGFRMALFAMIDKQTRRIVPVASSGKNEELMDGVRGLLSTPEKASQTMLAEAIRRKTPLVSNDSLNDSRILLPKQYTACGVHSMTIFPLMVDEEVIGVLTLYATEPDFFHDEELRLLKDLAGDISYAIDHIEKQERLSYLAYYDDLTGLANRNLFLERVAQYTRTANRTNSKVAIGLLDIERFKSINDSMGRTNGDALLKQTADWLAPQAGDSNLAARIDADHFALVIPMFHSDGNLARRVEDLMSGFLKQTFDLPSGPLRVGIKGGFAVFPDDGPDADALFLNAESALKRAKLEGERYLFYTRKMTSMVATQLSLEHRLRLALERQEFVLHYQPKIEIPSQKLTGVEALIRWNDPRNGMASPSEFIPVLEDTGLINEVGRWALGQALNDYLRWKRSGLNAVRVAVNVSPLQLRSRNFIDDIQAQIRVAEEAASGLELEITESLLMADVEHSIRSLHRVREMGVQIAVDDFGTGFSSLSYLAKLPVDKLKIDRSFISAMTDGPEGLALVSNIINLAHSLNLRIVAEGVETDDQLQLLRLLTCDEAQGYLISPGIAVKEFEEQFLTLPTKE